MKWRWPLLSSRRKLVAERHDAEARAAKVHWEVVEPLRRMRAKNHLGDAVFNEIRKHLKESGG